MSADPLTIHGLGGDLNAYAYVSGRALKSVDPLGLQEASINGPALAMPGTQADPYASDRKGCGADCEVADAQGWMEGEKRQRVFELERMEVNAGGAPKKALPRTAGAGGPRPDRDRVLFEIARMIGENAIDSGMPVWAEWKDFEAYNDPSNPTWVRAVAAASLTFNGATLGAAPNVGRLFAKAFGSAPGAHPPRMPEAHTPVDRLPFPAIGRPPGIPDNWTSAPTKPNRDKARGLVFKNPNNPHDSVRVMPGNRRSPNPAQQSPYVIRMKDGRAIDAEGNPVDPKSPEAHIPLNKFRFWE